MPQYKENINLALFAEGAKIAGVSRITAAKQRQLAKMIRYANRAS